MNKVGLGIRLVCTSFLGFIGGVFTMSKHQEQEAQKIKEELFKVIKELQTTKELLKSKDKEISLKIEEALEGEREARVDDRIKYQKRIKTLEAQLNKDGKTNNTTL